MINYLTQDKLKALLSYDPKTGLLNWIVSLGGHVKTGKEAGHLRMDNYRVTRLNGQLYLSHRLAWLYMTGEWPKHQIDHMNGIHNDNRWCNLREANVSQNMRNRILFKNNTSGYKGVDLHKATGKWRARARHDGKLKHLGLFNDKESAYEAYLGYAKKHHGEFFHDLPLETGGRLR